MQPHEPVRPARRLGQDALALAILFAALAALSWRRWPDLLVDFGQQLYIPWRLSQGDLLHRDILFLHGPLSQHLNGLLFRLFGASLTVLIVANLVLLALLTGLLHEILRRAADRPTAFLGSVVFLALFGFPQYVMVGNYNYVCPYTHEAAHGLLLAAAMLLLLCRFLAEGRCRDAGVAGLCLGLALATKAEVALPALMTAGVGLALSPLLPDPSGERRRGVLLFSALALLPCTLFFLYFLSYLPEATALRAAAGGFLLLPGEAADNPFYRHVLGIDDLGPNLMLMLRMSGWLAGLLVLGVAAELLVRRLGRDAARWGAGGAVLLFAVLVVWPDLVPWVDLPRALPVAAACLLVVFLVVTLKARALEETAAASVPMLLLALLGLGMTGKALFSLRLFHYGFYLAPIAALALLATHLFWVPAVLRRRGLHGNVFRALSVAFVLAAVVYHLRWSWELYGLKDLAVGRGGDTIVTFGPSVQESGAITAEALRFLEENTPPTATLVGLPEAIMLNYQARRIATTPFVNFSMGEVNRFGEARLVESLERWPPDYVALVHKRSDEIGVGPFGVDPRYGRRVVAWVESRYDTVARFGAEPFTDGAFGIRILKQRAADAAGAGDASAPGEVP